MADKPPTPPPPRPPPDELPGPVATTPPVDVIPAEQASPEKGRPVVLATQPGTEFVLPAELDDKGEPKGEGDLRVTAAGVALSKTDADRVTKAAEASGVTLIEKEGSRDA